MTSSPTPIDHSSLDAALRSLRMLVQEHENADDGVAASLGEMERFVAERAAALPEGPTTLPGASVEQVIAQELPAHAVGEGQPMTRQIVAGRLAVLAADALADRLRPADVALVALDIRSAVGETPQPVALAIRAALVMLSTQERAVLEDFAAVATTAATTRIDPTRIQTDGGDLQLVGRAHEALARISAAGPGMSEAQLEALRVWAMRGELDPAPLEEVADALDPADV